MPSRKRLWLSRRVHVIHSYHHQEKLRKFPVYHSVACFNGLFKLYSQNLVYCTMKQLQITFHLKITDNGPLLTYTGSHNMLNYVFFMVITWFI